MSKLNIIKSYYEPKFEQNLPDYGILGWESMEAQYMRFEMLSQNIQLNHKKLLDVGCGLGNLLEFLDSKNIKIEYTGVDILESMIEGAINKGLEGEFYCVDIFQSQKFKAQTFDVVYSSGIFNLNLGNNVQFLKNALGCFFELAKEAIVFNLLHEKSPDREETYFYFNPDEVVKLIEQSGFPLKSVKIVEQYLKNDFTVICEKG